MDIGSQRSLRSSGQEFDRFPYTPALPTGKTEHGARSYVMVAIMIVAMAGIAVGFGLNSRNFRPTRVRIDQGRERSSQNSKRKPRAMRMIRRGSRHSQQAAGTIADGSGQWHRTNPRPAGSGGENAARRIPRPNRRQGLEPAPLAPWAAQKPAEPLSTAAAPIEVEMKTDVVGWMTLPARTTRRRWKTINQMLLPAPQSPAAGTKAPRAEAAGHAAKPGQARHGNTSGQSWPASSDCQQGQGDACELTHHEVISADPKAKHHLKPSPATNGTFGFVGPLAELAYQRHRQVIGVGNELNWFSPLNTAISHYCWCNRFRLRQKKHGCAL